MRDRSAVAHGAVGARQAADDPGRGGCTERRHAGPHWRHLQQRHRGQVHGYASDRSSCMASGPPAGDAAAGARCCWPRPPSGGRLPRGPAGRGALRGG
eukprot:5978191-Pyramimonas_sp.AAC.1